MSSPARPLRYRGRGQPPPGIHTLDQLRAVRRAMDENPELIVTGMGCPSVCNLLEIVAHPILDHGLRLHAGMVLDLGAPLAGLIDVARPGWWLAVARELSVQPVTALQLALSDEELRLPAAPGFADDFVQPLLGNPMWTVPGWRAPEPVSVFDPPTGGDQSATL